MKTCSICKEKFLEFGNNAWPINRGRCCNDCNLLVVMPARIQMMYEARAQGRALRVSIRVKDE